ncbi:calpain-A-like isoform X1 [Adelges cooleyi]|uniref:calpain-A-like isoform X1 n=1 Tax=Adelges cooleyi TaxID=133065 RepID=UPI00217F91C9|nr:calpain-A-like isoform X1 [Adelges cooleyi]
MPLVPVKHTPIVKIRRTDNAGFYFNPGFRPFVIDGLHPTDPFYGHNNLKERLTRRGSTEYGSRGYPGLSVYKIGERGSGFRPKAGEVQDFEVLRDQCLQQGALFEDPDFDTVDSSIFYSRRPDKSFEWRRPNEIANNPQLFIEGATRFDVKQGELGDCWLLAAVANLTLNDKLFNQVVPNDQSFGNKYAGIFHFRFWQYGRWVDVVVDDRLPTYNGQLVFLRSATENEFWSALLEKAYAKLHGSYEALKGGSTCEAMEDFTGGVSEMFELNEAPPNLFTIMLHAFQRFSLMGCSIEADPSVTEMETPQGLVKGHAYSITRVTYVDITTPNTTGQIPLLRLRNPWGNEAEWNGPWSDKSPEWRFISESDKRSLGLTFDADGEFWMSYKDFVKYFSRLEICNLNPDLLTKEHMGDDPKKRWEMSVFEGEWVRGATAGGCRNFLDTFANNPQYRITLDDPDDDDDQHKCTAIIALMQKNRRAMRKTGAECLTIGFAVYQLTNPDSLPKPLDVNFFKYNASVARSPTFINLREVSSRFSLPPGDYCIVPSTFDPNEQGEFLLRVFSEHKNNMEELDDNIGIGEIDIKIKEKEPEPAKIDAANEKIKEFFLKLAGDDQEVDWMELKEILDYAMRNDVASTTTASDNVVVNLLQTFCQAFCQNTALGATFNMEKAGFSKDVCRSMIAMLDWDRSGKLGFDEFKTLWVDIRQWKLVFKMYDKESKGYISGFDMRQALNSVGYHLNSHILNILCHRYATKDGTIMFDDFIMCAVRLKTMIDMFKERDPDNKNVASFSLEEWVEKTLYS